MNIEKVIKYFGSIVRTAAALDVSVQTVYAWKESGIPYTRQCQIEVETQGKFKAKKNNE